MLHHSLDPSFYFEDSSIIVLTVWKIQNGSIIQGGHKPSIIFGVLQYIEYISEYRL